MPSVTSVSFIVPAHDEERLLGRTLEAIGRAARALDEPTEIIVVDDASTDRTAAIARAHGARVVAVNVRQISAARNAGAREAIGQTLAFVDADTTITDDVVRAAVAAVRRGAVGGGSAFRFDAPVPLHGRLLLAVVAPLYRAFRLASGCFLFCTRAAFDAAGGWDESLFAAEETAMSQALHRQGRFVILRECVTTSGRKLRAYSGRETLVILARLALGGREGVRRRDGLGIWYDQRRADPMDDTDTVENPRTGERVTFLSETPELLVMDVTWPQPGHRAAPHLHPGMEERFAVVEGRAAWRFGGAGGATIEGGPGTIVTVPPGVVHLAWNPTETLVRLRIEMRPALRWREFTTRLFAGENPMALLAAFAPEVRIPDR